MSKKHAQLDREIAEIVERESADSAPEVTSVLTISNRSHLKTFRATAEGYVQMKDWAQKKVDKARVDGEIRLENEYGSVTRIHISPRNK